MRAREVLVVLLITCSFVGRADDVPLTNADVIQMVRAGISTAVIQAKIAASKTAFDTSTSALLELSKAKVPDSVVTAMIDRGRSSGAPATQLSESGRTNSPPPFPPSSPSRGVAPAARTEPTFEGIMND